MMTKNQMNERNQLEMLTIEQLVLENHLVRKLVERWTFHLFIQNVKKRLSASVRMRSRVCDGQR